MDCSQCIRIKEKVRMILLFWFEQVDDGSNLQRCVIRKITTWGRMGREEWGLLIFYAKFEVPF